MEQNSDPTLLSEATLALMYLPTLATGSDGQILDPIDQERVFTQLRGIPDIVPAVQDELRKLREASAKRQAEKHGAGSPRHYREESSTDPARIAEELERQERRELAKIAQLVRARRMSKAAQLLEVLGSRDKMISD